VEKTAATKLFDSPPADPVELLFTHLGGTLQCLNSPARDQDNRADRSIDPLKLVLS